MTVVLINSSITALFINMIAFLINNLISQTYSINKPITLNVNTNIDRNIN